MCLEAMGVVNITPDSFSDGGEFFSKKDAIARCDSLLENNIDIIDLGAESTRPGALEVTCEEEWRRLEPVLKYLQKTSHSAFVSVDTRKPEIMLRALDLGVDLINNVCSVLPPTGVVNKISSYDAAYLGMHIHLSPQTMQKDPLNVTQALAHVESFFAKTSSYMQENGLDSSQIWLDPGIGFGKDDSANLSLLAQTSNFSKKYNIALGISRKSFLTRVFSANSLDEKDLASKTLEFGLIASGAKIIRTHSVFKPIFKVCFTKAAK